MSLISKKDRFLKQVPWLSEVEWYDVYKKIYSNDLVQQTKAYEILLGWKTRMPKLPAGVDSTLLILEVCICDREWMAKIDSGQMPMYCMNELSLMYSTAIMKFLNHVTAVGHTRQKSLFAIAKKLKIPEWIVNLRHNAAHGYELESLDSLRIAVNILLEWLHGEYWAVEANAIEKHYINMTDTLEEKNDIEEPINKETLKDLLELWTTVGLYIDAGYESILQIPDSLLRETLTDLWGYHPMKSSGPWLEKYNKYEESFDHTSEISLRELQALIYREIREYPIKNKIIKANLICDELCKSKIFLPNSSVIQIFLQKEKEGWEERSLPPSMLTFWEDIIKFLHEKHMLEILIFKLFDIVHEQRETKEKRKFAAAWISSIMYSFVQLDIALTISNTAEYSSKLFKSDDDLNKCLKQHIQDFNYPYLRHILWLDIAGVIPHFLFDINFLLKVLLHVNEFSTDIIEPVLKLNRTIDEQAKEHLINLIKINTFQNNENDNNKNVDGKIFTIGDYLNSRKDTVQIHKKETAHLLTDQAIRNSQWKVALDIYPWNTCSIGLLPWQKSLKNIKRLQQNSIKHSVPASDFLIIPGMINTKNLKNTSCINWDKILREKKRPKKKCDKATVLMERAVDILKNQGQIK